MSTEARSQFVDPKSNKTPIRWSCIAPPRPKLPEPGTVPVTHPEKVLPPRCIDQLLKWCRATVIVMDDIVEYDRWREDYDRAFRCVAASLPRKKRAIWFNNRLRLQKGFAEARLRCIVRLLQACALANTEKPSLQRAIESQLWRSPSHLHGFVIRTWQHALAACESENDGTTGLVHLIDGRTRQDISRILSSFIPC